MNQLAIRTLDIVTAEITSIQQQVKNMLLYSSIEIGQRLVEAKELVDHGGWGEWLQEYVDYSQSTANNLMKLYKEYGTGPFALTSNSSNSQALGNLSYTQAYALIGIPAEERVQFVEDNNVEELSSRELQRLVKQEKELKEQLEKSNAEAEKERIKQEAMAKSVKELEEQNKLNYDLAEFYKREYDQAKENENLKEMETLQKLLTKAKNDLDQSQGKIKKLEVQLKEKPIEVTATIEKIPDEVEKELVSLRQRVRELNNASTVKFGYTFETIVSDFESMLNALKEIQESEIEVYPEYKKATNDLLHQMITQLNS